tara:strand:+ start:240 stop:800 length:561 start_codon:yes stop_codon:yes gene_type:complete
MRGQKGQTYHDWVGTESWTGGQETEASFGELLEERYPGARPATLPEQYMHIDWVCSAGSIDVKALKRKSRTGAKTEDFIWLEFKNNRGDKGWLYGQQDFIAFECIDHYLVVRREHLKDLAEELCSTNKSVATASDALYKGYTRRNRDDVISMIRRSDLLKIQYTKLNKICRTSTNTTKATPSSSRM